MSKLYKLLKFTTAINTQQTEYLILNFHIIVKNCTKQISLDSERSERATSVF